MKMVSEIIAFAGIVFLIIGAVGVTVIISDHWLVRQRTEMDEPQLRRPLRVKRIKKLRQNLREPRRIIVFPNNERRGQNELQRHG